jgi:dihydrofolate reductase
MQRMSLAGAGEKSQRQAPLVSLVAAVATNGVIGRDGRLPWHLPGDLRFFKAQTMGGPVIMGRRTWESIGKPLPGRRNIVVSRNTAFHPTGVSVARSVERAIALCAGEEKASVIGGNTVFRDALPHASLLLLTEIHRDYEGDVYFPAFDRSQWKETRREPHPAQGDQPAYDFVWYERTGVG